MASFLLHVPLDGSGAPGCAAQPTTHLAHMHACAQVINENDSPLLNDTLTALGLNATGGFGSPDDFTESNMKHSMNGLLFCNAQNFTMTLGTK